jgi:hypothetical protein
MLDIINTAWPIFLGMISLVIILAKMHNEIDVLKEKVRVLYDLWNNRKGD